MDISNVAMNYDAVDQKYFKKQIEIPAGCA